LRGLQVEGRSSRSLGRCLCRSLGGRLRRSGGSIGRCCRRVELNRLDLDDLAKFVAGILLQVAGDTLSPDIGRTVGLARSDRAVLEQLLADVGAVEIGDRLQLFNGESLGIVGRSFLFEVSAARRQGESGRIDRLRNLVFVVWRVLDQAKPGRMLSN
jgi:hypothetical protein